MNEEGMSKIQKDLKSRHLPFKAKIKGFWCGKKDIKETNLRIIPPDENIKVSHLH